MAKSGKPRRAAVGFRSHSGWSALVALAASDELPEVIERRRIETADPAIRGSKQPYHTAEPMNVSDAEGFIAKCTESTKRMSREALGGVMRDLEARGFEAVRCGVILGSGRPLPPLSAILASHALLHTAEGEFYRLALVEAGKHCGLAVMGVREREAFEQGAVQLSIPAGVLQSRIAGLGKAIGPPWAQDQKYAALAAWIALTHDHGRLR